MGSRKENLKKSLGISEYPWSSDEEDNSTAQPVPVLRRPSDESRPSVADTPGTSISSAVSGGNSSTGGIAGSSGNSTSQGPQSMQPSTPATVRRQQAKMDRELFWSIINNSPRPVSVSGCPARSRVDVPLTHVARPPAPSREMAETRRTERSQADIHRILAFKRLTRNLSLRQSRHNASIQATNSRRVPSGPCSSRSTLFSPELAAAAANAARARAHSCCSRSSPSRSSQPGSPRNVAEGSSSVRYRGVMTRTPSGFIIGNPSRSQLIPSDHFVNVEQSDEEAEPVPDAPPAQEPPVVNNAEEENVEAPTNNTSAGAISLEEIVEIDAPDEPDTPLAAEIETDTTEQRINNESNAVATNSDENAEASQQQSPFHGVKRKRETSDENAEPYSVQEFNQSLLRLLECPVCLEWMEPPISQCRRGHLVCSRCRTRLASCPVCRTTFSSVRNRAMEGVAEMLRYPCRHGCGREVRLRRRAPHEASCGARRYHCPAPPCARHPPLAHHELAHHFQCKHLPILKIGRKHKFSMKVNSEQHDTWLIMALDEYFHLRVDVDIRTWGVIVYVAYIGPKRKAKHYTYEVTVEGQHNSRSLKYARATHSDLESSSLNVSRQDCFHLTLDQALNFLRFKNRHCEPDKFLDFDVEIDKCQNANAHESKDESDS